MRRAGAAFAYGVTSWTIAPALESDPAAKTNGS